MADENTLQEFIKSGEKLAESIMKAHSEGAKRSIQIMKAAAGENVKAIEQGAKTAAETATNATTSVVAKAKEVAKDTAEGLSAALTQSASFFKDEMKDISDFLAGSFKNGEIGSSIKGVFDKVEQSLSQKMSGMTKSLGIEVDGEDMKKLTTDMTTIFLNIKNIESSKPFENMSKDGDEFASRVSGNIKNINEFIPKLGLTAPLKFLIDTAATFESAADSARTFESSILSTSYAAGRYEDVMKRINGLDGDGFDRFASQFVNKAAAIGNATNQNAKDVMAFQQSLMQIKGGLDETIDSLGYASGETDVLTAAIKVSAGAGLKTKDTLDMMTQQYMNFGTAAGKSVQDVAKLSMVSQNLEVPLDKIKSGISSVVSSLIYYKDNTEAAINITSRLGSSLKEAGMSPEAISKLTSVVSKNVAEMQLAQRAFLSQQTGGPGGLAGGYQIQLLKEQGKLDEVQKLTEQALKKQFGGNVLTIDDAVKGEDAARQYAKQVQLVTSGPTKVVDNEDQASALFKAMKQGVSSDFMSGKQALDETANRGEARIKRQESEINKLNNAAIVSASRASLIAAESSRRVSEIYRQVLANTKDLDEDSLIRKGLSKITPSSQNAAQTAVNIDMNARGSKTASEIGTDFVSKLWGEVIGDDTGMSKALNGGGVVRGALPESALDGDSKSTRGGLTENILGTVVVQNVCQKCSDTQTMKIAMEAIGKSAKAVRDATTTGHAAHNHP